MTGEWKRRKYAYTIARNMFGFLHHSLHYISRKIPVGLRGRYPIRKFLIDFNWLWYWIDWGRLLVKVLGMFNWSLIRLNVRRFHWETLFKENTRRLISDKHSIRALVGGSWCHGTNHIAPGGSGGSWCLMRTGGSWCLVRTGFWKLLRIFDRAPKPRIQYELAARHFQMYEIWSIDSRLNIFIKNLRHVSWGWLFGKTLKLRQSKRGWNVWKSTAELQNKALILGQFMTFATKHKTDWKHPIEATR